MKIEYIGDGVISQPPYGLWETGTVKDVDDARVAEGLLRRADFREVRAKREPAVSTQPERAPASPTRKSGGR